MKKTAEDILSLYKDLNKLTKAIRVTNGRFQQLGLSPGVWKTVQIIKDCRAGHRKLMFIGNGASASISSHMAADFLKNGGIKAIAFNDAALLTCLSNDLGYEHVFEKPVEMLAYEGDLLIAISSSGKSKNILRAVERARLKKCHVITLSGFANSNPLSRLGDINFYVPAQQYSHVEIIHHSLLHYILDIIVQQGGC